MNEIQLLLLQSSDKSIGAVRLIISIRSLRSILKQIVDNVLQAFGGKTEEVPSTLLSHIEFCTRVKRRGYLA